jgi:hypothetical protein
MKMRDKLGNADFIVTDVQSGKTVLVKNSDYLTRVQQYRMPDRAEYILGYAHFLCEIYGEDRPVQVHVDSQCSYNGRIHQPLVDPTANLCEKRVDLFSSSVGDWIVPMMTPFHSRLKDHKAKIVKDGVAAILESDPAQLVNKRVAKYLGNGDLHFGTVVEFIPDNTGDDVGTWVVHFDSGKQKYFSIQDMARRFDLYASKRRLDAEYIRPPGGATCSIGEGGAECKGN